MPHKYKYLSGSQKLKMRKRAEELTKSQVGDIFKLFPKEPQTSSGKKEQECVYVDKDNVINVEANVDGNVNVDEDDIDADGHVNEDDIDVDVQVDKDDVDLDEDDVDANMEGVNLDEGNMNTNIDIFDPRNWDTFNPYMINILVEKGPKRDLTIHKGPVNSIGRRFSSSMYTRRLSNGETCDRVWLVYSKEVDKLFCFCCKLFRKGQPKGGLDSAGFANWKHSSIRLKDHESSIEHMKNMKQWFEMLKRLKCKETIDKVAYEQFKKERYYWREVIFRILALVKFLAKNGLAFRGSYEKLYQKSNGNFLGLIEMLEEFDPIIKEHVRRIMNDELNVHYLGHNIQNELIGFLVVDDTTGKGLFDVTLEELKSLGLDVNNMRGQGYDNGSNMKGKHQGV
ncbi:uncharacterized protein LOC143552344 [Bidens hawaiensis]|uniref:uncharacterized protein LOC143552344 n=1 Tax=Bidens hawaiensis TaxID=980011 RepID=UPI004049B4BA